MSDVIAKATEQLLKLVDEVHANYGDRYDVTRNDLPMGDVTDYALANNVYMYGNMKPTIEDMLNGHMPIIYLTAAKERIRWLSYQNYLLSQQIAKPATGVPVEELKALVEDLEGYGKLYMMDKLRALVEKYE